MQLRFALDLRRGFWPRSPKGVHPCAGERFAVSAGVASPMGASWSGARDVDRKPWAETVIHPSTPTRTRFLRLSSRCVIGRSMQCAHSARRERLVFGFGAIQPLLQTHASRAKKRRPPPRCMPPGHPERRGGPGPPDGQSASIRKRSSSRRDLGSTIMARRGTVVPARVSGFGVGVPHGHPAIDLRWCADLRGFLRPGCSTDRSTAPLRDLCRPVHVH